MYNYLKSILTALFVLLIFLGYIVNVTLLNGAQGHVQESENRNIAQYPHWKKRVDAIQFFKDFDLFLNDRLFKREQILKHSNSVMSNDRWYYTFNDHAQGITGIDGWLFLANYHNETLKKHLQVVDEKAMPDKIAGTVNWINDYRQKYAVKYGAPFYVFITPDKPSIYCEKVPSWLKQKSCSNVTDYTDRIITGLEEHDFKVLYPQKQLKKAAAKEQMYFKTDAHWNFSGAEIGYKLMMDFIKEPAFTDYKLTHGVDRFVGDVAHILGKEEEPKNSQSAILTLTKQNILWKELGGDWNNSTLMQTTAGHDANFIAEMANNNGLNDKRVLVLCDSFTGKLAPFVNASFKHVLYVSRHFPVLSPEEIQKRADWIDTFKPEIVIFQIVERML